MIYICRLVYFICFIIAYRKRQKRHDVVPHARMFHANFRDLRRFENGARLRCIIRVRGSFSFVTNSGECSTSIICSGGEIIVPYLSSYHSLLSKVDYFRIKQRVSFITSRARRANKHRAVLSLFRLCLVSSALALALALFSPRLRPHLPSFPPFPVLALLSAPGFAASYAPALLSRRCVACTFID